MIGAETLGDVDLELDAEVTTSSNAATADLSHALMRDGDPVARAGAGGHLHLELAVEGGNGDVAAQQCGGEADGGRMEDVRPLPAEPLIGRDPDEDVEIPSSRPHVRVGRHPGRRRISLGRDPQSNAVVDTGGDVDVDRSSIAHDPIAVAGVALLALGDDDALAPACVTGARHLETARHEVDARPGPVAFRALASLDPRLEASAAAGRTLDQRRDGDGFLDPLGGVHKGDGRLHLDVVPDQNLLLKWRVARRPSSSSTAAKRAEEILKGEFGPEASGTRARTTKAGESARSSAGGTTKRSRRSRRGGARGIEASTLIERRRTKLIPGLFFLGVG